MLMAKQERKKEQHLILKKFQKLCVILLVLGMIQMPMQQNAVAASEDFQTIYHTYINDEYIGAISNEADLEALQAEKINAIEQQYGQYDLFIEEGFSVIPERVFKAQTEDTATLKQLEDTLKVQTEAVAVTVQGQAIVHMKDEQQAKELERRFKLQYVTEEQLQDFEKFSNEAQQKASLEEGEARIIDLKFDKEVAFQAVKTLPEKVQTIEQALQILSEGNLVKSTYIVEAGDAFEKIAKAHHMTIAQLKELNDGFTEETILQIGDELTVASHKPFVDLEVQYESKAKKVIDYEKVQQEDATILKGENQVVQEGRDGEQIVTETRIEKNGQVLEQKVVDEQIITESVDEITVVGTKVIPSRGTGQFVWPTVGGYVSSQMGQRWGRLHQGIDIARPSNRSILAADNGIVVATGVYGTYGNRIEIDHGNGYKTLYGHLASINVQPGQKVTAGTNIGVMGSTGRSTGIHLHFEVRKNDQLINPLSVLN